MHDPNTRETRRREYKTARKPQGAFALPLSLWREVAKLFSITIMRPANGLLPSRLAMGRCSVLVHAPRVRQQATRDRKALVAVATRVRLLAGVPALVNGHLVKTNAPNMGAQSVQARSASVHTAQLILQHIVRRQRLWCALKHRAIMATLTAS